MYCVSQPSSNIMTTSFSVAAGILGESVIVACTVAMQISSMTRVDVKMPIFFLNSAFLPFIFRPGLLRRYSLSLWRVSFGLMSNIGTALVR